MVFYPFFFLHCWFAIIMRTLRSAIHPTQQTGNKSMVAAAAAAAANGNILNMTGNITAKNSIIIAGNGNTPANLTGSGTYTSTSASTTTTGSSRVENNGNHPPPPPTTATSGCPPPAAPSELEIYLRGAGCYASPEALAHRRDVLKSLNILIRQGIQSLSLSQGMHWQYADRVGGKIITYGSYELGISHQLADIDALFIAPSHITRF